MKTKSDDEFSIARMQLMPGDVLVARLKGCVSTEDCDRVKDIIVATIGCPGPSVLVFDESVALSVLSKAQAAAA